MAPLDTNQDKAFIVQITEGEKSVSGIQELYKSISEGPAIQQKKWGYGIGKP